MNAKSVDDQSSRLALSHGVEVVSCMACRDAHNQLLVSSKVHTAMIVVLRTLPCPLVTMNTRFARVVVFINRPWSGNDMHAQLDNVHLRRHAGLDVKLWH